MMVRFSKDTQEIINQYTDKLCDFVNNYIIAGIILKSNNEDFKNLLEDFAWDIHTITCEHMIDID